MRLQACAAVAQTAHNWMVFMALLLLQCDRTTQQELSTLKTRMVNKTFKKSGFQGVMQ